MNPYLSLIIPCYNSSAIIQNQLPGLMAYLSGLGFTFEVVLVDDGSKNQEELKNIATTFNCRYIAIPKNKGKGNAVRTGMSFATGTYKIFTDSDIPFNYESIPLICSYLDKKEFHLAIGDRTLEGSSYFNEIPTRRKLGSALFTFFVGRFVTTGLNDTQCGIKGFRKEAAEDIFGVSRLNGFAFDVELLYIALKRNYDIKRVPVLLRSQEGTTVSLWRHTLPMIIDLLSIKWNHLKGYYNRRPI